MSKGAVGPTEEGRADSENGARMTGSPSDGALEGIGINVAFKGLRALSDVSLNVGAGELVGLIGPNGSGKTTFLNVLSGFQVPSGGEVRLRGANTRGWAPERLVQAGVSRTFQGVRAFGRLSVIENIEVGAIGKHTARRVARRRAAELVTELGLGEYAEMAANVLPAGVQRRLGIARALAAEPDFLLLDEPAAGLDDVETEEIIGFIGALRLARTCGIILVEHDMRVIMKLCDRVQVLNHGKTIAVGTPAEVRQNVSVLEAYLGASRSYGDAGS
jgi:ABC-type branched-subunit amino acid transport system ATPase component